MTTVGQDSGISYLNKNNIPSIPRRKEVTPFLYTKYAE
jgi:hypothetical protein